MKPVKIYALCIAVTLITVMSCNPKETNIGTKNNTEKKVLKTYLIERETPNAGQLSQKELKGISQKSNQVIDQMGSDIKWMYSYVTDDKVYCVYQAKNKETIEIHGQRGGFPVNNIKELLTKINPETSDN